MGDDKCGAETTSGDPCQNPAASCPWHDDDPPDTGRDFAITDDDHEDILRAAREGFSKSGCARAAGVSHTALDRYLEAHEDFRATFTRARHEGERELLRNALYEDEDAPRQMDGQHARFILSTSFDYKKTERKEVTGPDGDAVDIEVSSEVVTVTDSDE
jgi:predicted transcriptional regulator